MNPILRYPPVQAGENTSDDAEALQKELEKEKPRKDVVLPLFKRTFPERRQYILTTSDPVSEVTSKYKALLLPYAVRI